MPKLLRTPLTWMGGKGNFVSKILDLLPPHKQYVEPFGGGASLLMAKIPSELETYNDIDSRLVNFFRVLRDPELFGRFYQMAVWTPTSREEFNLCKDNLESDDLVIAAHRFYVVARQSFGGFFGRSWTTTVTQPNYRNSILHHLPAMHERLIDVQVEHADWRRILKRYDGPDYFAYCDPPYVSSTRGAGQYTHELSDDDHQDLVDRLLTYKGKVILSGYPNDIYKRLESNGWARRDFKTVSYAVARTKAFDNKGSGKVMEKHSRIEALWLNYDPNVQVRNEPLVEDKEKETCSIFDLVE